MRNHRNGTVRSQFCRRKYCQIFICLSYEAQATDMRKQFCTEKQSKYRNTAEQNKSGSRNRGIREEDYSPRRWGM
jgi:hypothetical protein